MIATVVFFAEERVFEGMLMGNVGAAMVCKRVRQIFVWARAGFEDVKLVGHIWGRSQEGMEEARWLGGIQGGCCSHWRAIWFAFILESGLCL